MKQPPRVVLRKRCSEIMQQIYRRTPMPTCDFYKVALQITLRQGCSPVILLHIFRTLFLKNTSEQTAAFRVLTFNFWNMFYNRPLSVVSHNTSHSLSNDQHKGSICFAHRNNIETER